MLERTSIVVDCWFVRNVLNWCLLTPFFALTADKWKINVTSTVGNSANQAIELLIQKGVPESHIIFLNLISVS